MATENLAPATAINKAGSGHGSKVDVVIVGAGPYGLSLAAYLKAYGVGFRIFGRPMHTWLKEMPKGMKLKSEGFASFLYDPGETFTLAHYCREKGLPYSDEGLPVQVETFSAYGLEFQKRLVPELENKLVTSVRRTATGFEVGVDDGEIITARRVVMSVGITHFAYIPPELSGLPEEFVSHSSKHNVLDRFKGREVSVVGAGASGCDIAGLLNQAGASVQLVARKTTVRIHDPPEKNGRSLLQRLRAPGTGIGSGWKVFFFANVPGMFHHMPESYRLREVRRTLGPAAGWFIRELVVGKVPFNLGVKVTQAKVQNGRVSLELTDATGARKTLESDHVIAATGYKVDLRRLTMLDADIQAGLKSVEHTPILSGSFESSIPGLYFTGPSAANSFGPLFRFAFGAKFAAGRIANHLKKSPAPVESGQESTQNAPLAGRA